MWRQIEAILLLAKLHQKVLKDAGFALNLGGSVLYKGLSENDLDVVAIKSMNHGQDKQKLIQAFIDEGLSPYEDKNFYGLEVVKLQDDKGRRIDVIIPKVQYDDET